MSVLTSFKHLGLEQWRVPRRNVCLVLSVTPARVSRSRRPSASLSFPQGSPRGRQTRTPPAPPTSRPGIPRGWGHLVATLHPTAVPFRACPGESPFPVQFGSRGRAETRLPPPDPQRRALTEQLCRPADSGSAPARCGRGSGLALRPRGRARAQSAAPSLLPQLRWGPRPPRLRPLSRPRRPAAALPGQRRATVT